jgi:GT2 family glycosyltransferase
LKSAIFITQERNCARQRNFAIAQAKYKNLLLVDDDVEVDKRWVEELFRPIWSDPAVGATMGVCQSADGNSDVLLADLSHRAAWSSERISTRTINWCRAPKRIPDYGREADCLRMDWWRASAVRREAFESVGGFASFFTGSSPGEDLDLGYRLSRTWKVYYVPAAKCIHHQLPPVAKRRINTSIFPCVHDLEF